MVDIFFITMPQVRNLELREFKHLIKVTHLGSHLICHYMCSVNTFWMDR